MGTLQNPSLTVDPAAPGTPLFWTWTQQATAMAFASFGLSRFERFDTWTAGLRTYASFAEAHTATARFGDVGALLYENFERRWLDNETFEAELGQCEAAPLASFETDWSGIDFAYALAPGSFTAGIFAPSASSAETFSGGWRSNENFAFTLGAVTSFPVETFENVKPSQPFTVNLATQQIVAVGHQFFLNSRATLFNQGDGELPANTNSRLKYFVVSPTADTLKLAFDAGGAPIVMGDPGSGTNFLKADTDLYWTELL